MSEITKTPYPEHPNRCQSNRSTGQCPNLGLVLDDGSYAPYCIAHSGAAHRSQVRKESVRNYRLTIVKWRTQVDQKVESAGIKCLREEIAILRVCLEERLNKCKDATDLILQSGPIADMVMKIDRVVSSCHKLEGSMGQLLDKQAILQFAQIVIKILTDTLDDEDQINTIAEQILASVGKIGND